MSLDHYMREMVAQRVGARGLHLTDAGWREACSEPTRQLTNRWIQLHA